MGKTCLVKNFCEKKVSFTVFFFLDLICLQVTVYCNYSCSTVFFSYSFQRAITLQQELIMVGSVLLACSNCRLQTVTPVATSRLANLFQTFFESIVRTCSKAELNISEQGNCVVLCLLVSSLNFMSSDLLFVRLNFAILKFCFR